jgi:hypothetical protein
VHVEERAAVALDEVQLAAAMRERGRRHVRRFEGRPRAFESACIPSRLARSDSSSPRWPASTRTIASFCILGSDDGSASHARNASRPLGVSR